MNKHDDNDEDKLAYPVITRMMHASYEDDDCDDNEFGSTGFNSLTQM
jgi:hypothetical protein